MPETPADSEAVGGARRGAIDGIPRCPWAGSDLEYVRYHDEEWGRPLHGERPLYEKLSLEGFQAGLSWRTILYRRPGFRAAFAGFDPEVVAGYGEAEVARLLGDAGIIRHRGKIEAAVANARAVLELRAEGGLDALVWSFAPATHVRPRTIAELPAVTAESTALSKALRARGFRFVGPTTMYALMQSAGLVDDHVQGCFRAD